MLNIQIKERPILFSGAMVRALRDGSKTQTRRIVKPQPIADSRFVGGAYIQKSKGTMTAGDVSVSAPYVSLYCPYGQPGDRLWVRETFSIVPRTAYASSDGVQQTLRADDPYNHDAAIYREGWERSNGGFRWRPSIHMPRWASRLLLEIVSVRVERLKDITEADAIAEGIERTGIGGMWRTYDSGCIQHWNTAAELGHRIATASYRSLWGSIHGPDSWDENPYVWVIEFKVVKP